MLEWTAGLLHGITVYFGRRNQGDDGSYSPPPHSFVDDEGRKIHVRTYNCSDFGGLTDMYIDFDPTQRAQGIPPIGEAAIHDWLDLILNGLSVLAWHEDRVVGHVMLVLDDEEHYELAIFVHQDYQRAGIGSMLIRTVFGYAREQGITDIWLSVERANRRAQKLYRHMGFRVDDPTGATFRISLRLKSQN